MDTCFRWNDERMEGAVVEFPASLAPKSIVRAQQAQPEWERVSRTEEAIVHGEPLLT
jgi:hypothetical protein